LIVGPLAGFYPAFVVSKFKTAAIFKNNAGLGLQRLRLRRLLIALQFVISITLISCTLIIRQQHGYLLSRQTGFSQENKLVIRTGDIKNLPVHPQVVKEALLQIPGVNGVSLSSHIPAEQLHGVATTVQRPSGGEAKAELELNLVDFDFMKLYGLQVVAGRPFSPSFAQDSIGALVVNETAVKQLGFKNPQEIIGQKFSQWEREGTVIGVVKDFNQHSLQSKIGPVTFQVNPQLYEKITVAYSGDAAAALQKIEQAWKRITGNAPFDYTFLDTWLQSQYEAEQRTATIFSGFSALAVFIACLGLYGLTMVSVRKRMKEIGIRKVLGASVNGLVGLLSKDFFRLVLIAFAVATPLAWYFMNRWLQDFAYRINIQWWMFVASGLVVLLVAMATVSVQAIKAALANPVKNLRTE
jgi:putative ABC transport system permease protein